MLAPSHFWATTAFKVRMLRPVLAAFVFRMEATGTHKFKAGLTPMPVAPKKRTQPEHEVEPGSFRARASACEKDCLKYLK